MRTVATRGKVANLTKVDETDISNSRPTKRSRPRIFDYDDYRQFVADAFAYLKANERGYSHRKFAKLAGLSSPNNLARVINGERSITVEAVDAYARGLRLDPDEARYFEHLIRAERANRDEDRHKHVRELHKLRKRVDLSNLDIHSYEYLANWYVVAIRELIGTKRAPKEPRLIAQLIKPRITMAEAEHAIELLLKLGMIKETEKSYQQTEAVLSTEKEVISAAARSYHRQMIRLAGRSIDAYDRSERVAGGLTAGVSETRRLALHDLLHRQRQEMLEFLTEPDASPKSRIVQVNYQTFPISESLL